MALIGSPALAQDGPPCGLRKAMTEKLERDYGESRQGLGLIGGQVLFEVWTSEKGTWTILLSRPDGTSCVMAVGENWQNVPKKVEPVGDPT